VLVEGDEPKANGAGAVELKADPAGLLSVRNAAGVDDDPNAEVGGVVLPKAGFGAPKADEPKDEDGAVAPKAGVGVVVEPNA